MIRSIWYQIVVVLVASLLPLPSRILAAPIDVPGSGLEGMPAAAHSDWLGSLSPGNDPAPPLTIVEPRPGAVLPANAAAPCITWVSNSSAVLVQIMGGQTRARAICTQLSWVPDREIWDRVRRAAIGSRITIDVAPLGGEDGRSILAGNSTFVVMDHKELHHPIAYLQLPVPFRTAKRHPGLATWRAARVSDPDEPPAFMTDLPVCANCHAYSADGTSMLLDMDIDGDKGGFILAATKREVTFTRADCHSWNSLAPLPPSPYSFGLFARLSPDGRLAAATVGETSLFVMIDRDDYSQLFFPVTGQIGIFDRARGTVTHLAGTTDPAFVHTGPSFDPSGKTVAFSRAPVRQDYVRAVQEKIVQNESSDTTIQALNARYPYQFDICTLPVPNAQGLAPMPLPGASANGKSNYFPRYSPDGRWIVFTRAPTGLVLQPGSRLCVVPARGGEARELACNTERMNSWHSWSPDGNWLVFSAKGQREETEIFLARMHADGTSAPAIRLHRLHMPRFACVVPEFLPGDAAAPRTVRLGFDQQFQINTQNNVR